MTLRWSAPLCLSAAAMLHANGARAAVWGMDPVLGVTGDYATNPVLLDVPNTAQTDAAAMIDAPTTFTGNDFKISVLPSFRVGDTKSYSSVNSDYEHLNIKGELDSDLSIWTANAGLSRDSSLYQNYLVNGEAGVRRDGLTADLNWDRTLTERLEVDTDVNTMRVKYAQPVGNASLVDYKYTSLLPTLAWRVSERAKLTFSASLGQYDSLDGSTRSRSENLQIGFVRPLTEIWSLTATGGYSRSQNRLDIDEEFLVFTPQGPRIVIVPLRLDSSQNASIYSAALTRHGERLTLNATASRQETPTGFAFLSRQNIAEIRADYSLTSRWSLSADVRYVGSRDPNLQNGQFYERNIDYFGLNAAWQWTEHWTLTLGISRVTEHYNSTALNLASNQVVATLSRKFNHISFQ